MPCFPNKLRLMLFCLLAGLLARFSLAAGCGETSLPPVLAESGSATQPLLDALRGPLSRLERSLFEDAADGALDRFSLFEAVLIAGGVDQPEVLRHYQSRLNQLAEELQKTGRLHDSIRENAETLLQFLHTRVFSGGYSLTATDVRQTLDHGRYNCVSATALYLCLAQRLHLRCTGLEMPGHALCRVFLPEGSLTVETTCPYGLARVTDPRRQAETASKLPDRPPDSPPALIHEVSPIRLAAMIYYNRGVDFLRKQRYREAAAANGKALTLDPRNPLARGNLLATVNNWSIALSEENHFAEAADLLRRGLDCDPNYAPFVQNFLHVHHQWTASLCREGRYAEASRLLTNAVRDLPREEFLRRDLGMVYRRWADALLSGVDLQEEKNAWRAVLDSESL